MNSDVKTFMYMLHQKGDIVGDVHFTYCIAGKFGGEFNLAVGGS